ncbi:MAG: SpoIID/LytB domain-containing protein [Armatimonadetes bacterium]|nr:SpoIID/LytB domain-containing protein [Armatimonadota bacterium]
MRRALSGQVYLALTTRQAAGQLTDAACSQPVADGPEGSRWTFRLVPGGIEIEKDEAVLGVFPGPIRLDARGGGLIEALSPKVRSPRYRGGIEISVRKSSRKNYLGAVNALPLEEYLYSVLPSEMPLSFHPEALKAQAVVARTYALQHLGRHKADDCDLCDGIHCQSYLGYDAERDKSRAAVDATRGEAIYYGGRLIYAVYSADCGGHTQSNEDGAMSRSAWSYLRAVPDRSDDGPDYCSGSRFHTWSRQFTLYELKRSLNRSPIARVGSLQEMRFLDYDPSGRVKTVELIGSREVKWITGGQFRQIMGGERIPSTLVTLTRLPSNAYRFDGRGFGHGVGFCQHGANGMAAAPQSFRYQDILKHYYQGVEIRPFPGTGSFIETKP